MHLHPHSRPCLHSINVIDSGYHNNRFKKKMSERLYIKQDKSISKYSRAIVTIKTI